MHPPNSGRYRWPCFQSPPRGEGHLHWRWDEWQVCHNFAQDSWTWGAAKTQLLRLGVLDASEIPPTYSAPEGQFVGIIAGGDVAIRHAQEGAEDDVDAAVRDLEALRLDGRVDSLIGIAASGRTPYVLGGFSYAKSRGCVTIGIACAEPSAMSESETVDYMISAVVGPEVVTGSTRMKAGTATKLVLNMLSTGTMIKIGKTFGNMVSWRLIWE